MTEPVKAGDTITVNYTGQIQGGDVFDSSEGQEPLKFTVGSGQLIQGFEAAVIGMKVGDSKTITITPEQGYGLPKEEMIIDLPKNIIPAEMELEIGMRVELMDKNGKPAPAMVVQILDNILKMDLNHPLAGKTIVFKIEIVETGLTPDPSKTGCGCGGGSGGCGSGGCGCGK